MSEIEVRIIKKYPNRRLYDTAISSYITLDNVKSLLLEGGAIKVIDARTKADLTHSTLLQILNELEDKQPPILTNQLLVKLIRQHGQAKHELIGQYLNQSLDVFLQSTKQQSTETA